MKFESRIFDEPLLEFGGEHSHSDPRLGLTEAGPLQAPLGDKVRIGVVGDAKTVESTRNYLQRAADGFESESETHPNMHPNFPGLRNRNPFRCEFDVSAGATRALSKAQIEKIVKEPDHAKAVEMAVEAILAQLQSLDDSGDRPDVAIIALPVALIERVWNARTDAESTTEKDDSGGPDAPNFRGLLKARAMPLTFPIQIVWEDVIDESAKIPRKIKESSERKIQNEAGRTWNLMATLYYKGTGRIPWRRLPKQGEFRACYIGVSFYRDVSGQQLWTSAAQMFDERGKGFILKGNRAQTESRGRHPYMTEEDAYTLVRNALRAYRDHHKHAPARVIILKTSRFRDEEADGILRALDEAETELRDLVWVQESYSVKILRDGDYPVLRGTFVELDGKGLLYTNGSIPYYGTYPGLYVPHPLLLCPHKSSDSTPAQVAEEILSLTKINWNSTQMNQRLPIPIRAARKVGEVLKYINEGQSVSSDYRKYI
ncbi:argonaute/piwi family protein [Enterovirga sp. CN4-39]|uniref:argonaute/piwi family protein n=1 Tax=Enterovirga sp. CN4-39 TaxID=3400910 RepID=UPI003C0D496A